MHLYRCRYTTAAAGDPNSEAANHVRYTLSHEVQHALDYESIARQESKLAERVGEKISAHAPRDYTDALLEYDSASKRIEVSAEIAGFNAFADHVKRTRPQATLLDIYHASEMDARMFIEVRNVRGTETAKAKGELQIDGDLHIVDTPKNREWMEKHYYRLNGYPKDEIGRAVSKIISLEKQEVERRREQTGDASIELPPMGATQKTLGVRMKFPREFINITRDRSLPPLQDEAAIGSSEAMPNKKRNRTDDDSAFDPELLETVSKRPKSSGSAQDAGKAPPPVATPDDERHPDHAFYRFLRNALPPEVPNNAVADAMSRAKAAGIPDVDHIAHREHGPPGAKEVLLKDGAIWIGGDERTGLARVGIRLDEAESMQDVAASLDEQRVQSMQRAGNDFHPAAQIHGLP